LRLPRQHRDFLGSSTPNVPYTNLPYVPDVGDECSSFPHPRVLDGADETISHEYAEALTDPFPSSGWTDRRGNEVADKCENLVGGQPGGSTYVTLATGTFAVQGVWANDLGKRGGCENAHSPILTVNPGRQKGVAGTPATLQVSASDVRGRSLTFTAAGLPVGLSINPATGLIAGTPQGRGRSVVTIVVSDGAANSTITFDWTIRR
jgi:serine protease